MEAPRKKARASSGSLTLSISLPAPAPEGLVRACAQLCARLGAPATVAATLSAVDDDEERFGLEGGAAIKLNAGSRALLERLWPALRQEFPQLECGHVEAASAGFSGCIHDFLRPSACPAAIRATARAAARAVA